MDPNVDDNPIIFKELISYSKYGMHVIVIASLYDNIVL
jgi:hypothetical protein